ncbi:YceI family protein [Alteraurantiacibacter aquimixticola]|uniref:YceI family protein n=1 Tax=Alteraurantiacibacter aquimixticola TaxID=2489173 RepID=A0A4T3F7Q1_9SPHN|nr:YceI family protein [Alteraurantiacibacter aquimixticola]TIX51762.1 YceI family protein [Alteraurantiacibacter aquimixticola]
MSLPARSSIILASLALAACSQAPAEEAPLAGDWVLAGDESNLAFVTVKAGQVAEAHRFDGLTGSVSADGSATLTIDLASVQTNIDVRDERMRDFLFDVAEFPAATVTTSLDPAAFAALKTGDSLIQPVTATLDLHGASGEIATELAVTRVDEGKVKVATIAPIIVGADAFDLAEGVEELRGLAGLDSITGQVPVTFSLTFEQQ